MKKLGRYSVYGLIGKNIEIEGEDFKESGECSDIFRDPILNQLIIVIGEDSHYFHEPESILGNENHMVLTYGSSEEFEDHHEEENEEEDNIDTRLAGFNRITKEHSSCRKLKIKVL
jgi:hypothetical protein